MRELAKHVQKDATFGMFSKVIGHGLIRATAHLEDRTGDSRRVFRRIASSLFLQILHGPSASRLAPLGRRQKYSLRHLLGVLVVGLIACGPSPDGESSSDLVSTSDAITIDELTAGTGYEDHDELTAEEEAGLSGTDGADDPVDIPNDHTNGAGETARRESCRAATGYRKGVPLRVCLTSVNGKVVETSTARAFVEMRAAARRAGVKLVVVSGFRTMTEQRSLYSAYIRGHGTITAPPGFSNHQSGHAIDLNTNAPEVFMWLTRNAATYGFERSSVLEEWQWERW